MDSSEDERLFITQSSTKGDISAEIKGNVVQRLDIFVSACFNSLSTSKGGVSSFFFLNREIERFRTPITASECEKFNKSWVSDASRRKWVLKVFEERKKQRNEAVLTEDYSSELVIQEDSRRDGRRGVGLYTG